MSTIFTVMTRYQGERADMADDLLADLKGMGAEHATITVDPGDDEPSPAGVWRCAKAAWRSYIGKPVTHVCVIQDDVILCDDFVRLAEERIAEMPNDALTFFSRRTAVRVAANHGERWVEFPGRDFLMAQAVVMPVTYVEPFITWADRFVAETEGDDVRLSAWLQNCGAKIYASAPSLVDHRQVPSLMKGRSTKRGARKFLGRTWPFPYIPED